MAEQAISAVRSALQAYDNKQYTARETVELLQVLTQVLANLDEEPPEPKPKPKPKPKPVVFVPQEPITLRPAVPRVAGCKLAVEDGANIDQRALAIAKGAPERMARSAAMWMRVPSHPFFCLVDPHSRDIISGVPTTKPPLYTNNPPIATFQDIENLIKDLKQPVTFPTFWLAALLMPSKASTTAIANPRLYTSANRSIPVSTFLTGGPTGKARLKKVSSVSSASELMSKFYDENVDELDTTLGGAWPEYVAGLEPFEQMTLGVLDKVRRVSQYGPKSAINGELAELRDRYCDTPIKFGLFLWAATGLAPAFAPFLLKSPVSTNSFLKKLHTNTFNALKPDKAKTTDLELACARHDFQEDVKTLMTGTPPPLLRLGEATSDSYTRQDYIFQRKHDGARATVHVWGNESTAWIFSKSGRRVFNTTWNSYVPDLERQLQLTLFGPRRVSDCVFDGELVTYDSDDNEMGLGAAIYDPTRVAKIRFVAFDCLVDSGRDVTGFGAADRLTRLQRLLGSTINSDWCRVSTDLSDKSWKDLQTYARANRWEGLVVKERKSPYKSGRSTECLRWKARNIKIVRTYATDNPYVRKLEPVEGVTMFVTSQTKYETTDPKGLQIDMNTGKVIEEAPRDRMFYESVTAANLATLQARYRVFGDPANIPPNVKVSDAHGLVAAQMPTNDWVVISATEAEKEGYKMYPLVPELKKNRTIRESDAYICYAGNSLTTPITVEFSINVAAACVKLKTGQSDLSVIGPDGTIQDNQSKLCDGDHLVTVNSSKNYMPPIFDQGASKNGIVRVNNKYYDSNGESVYTQLPVPLTPVESEILMTHEAFSIVLLPRDATFGI